MGTSSHSTTNPTGDLAYNAPVSSVRVPTSGRYGFEQAVRASWAGGAFLKTDTRTPLEIVAAARWRIAIRLTVVMMVIYFGFILLVAYGKSFLATLVAPGLSLGILLGALVIVVAWVLTWTYISWANRHYDEAVTKLRR